METKFTLALLYATVMSNYLDVLETCNMQRRSDVMSRKGGGAHKLLLNLWYYFFKKVTKTAASCLCVCMGGGLFLQTHISYRVSLN